MTGNRVTARATVGREVRLAREALKMSRAALAKALFVSESLIAKWESGKQAIKAEYMIKLLGILPIGPEVVARILDELTTGEIPPEWTDKWLSIEARANTLFSYDLSAVPGLLQNEDYARAVLQYNRHAPIDIEERVRSRLKRQDILTRDEPPTTVFVVDELVLHRRVGSRQVMYEQLMRLCELAERPDIYLQVVPADAEYYAGCPFILAKVNGTEVGYQDGATSGRVVDDPDEVASMGRIWEGIRIAALQQAASIELIEKVAGSWKLSA
jgi:transcriptional regulator with XRE-family HTH domain